jgi:putative endonuclease
MRLGGVRMYWVYILENPAGRFYIGSTEDLSRRLEDHNSAEKTFSKYTHKNGPWRLVWSQEHPTRSSAMRREKAIKSMKSATWIQRKLLRR